MSYTQHLFFECVGYICVDFNTAGADFFDRVMPSAFQEVRPGSL